MQSHPEWGDARRRDIPEWAWHGNRAADEQADTAAEEHAIPAAQLGCYEWVRTVEHWQPSQATHHTSHP
eukprot:2214333-Pyramimonas_sp.AAC.2